MEATRKRLGSAIEWALAATFFLLAIGAGSIALREFHTVTAVMPVTNVIAHESEPAAPVGVLSRAVSVPLLPLGDGRSVKVGDSSSEAAAALGTRAVAAAETIERTPAGERVTRTYETRDARVVLIVEESRVAAIYVQ
jgi:hypothetical protein